MSPIEKNGSSSSMLNFKAQRSLEENNSGSDSETYDSDADEIEVPLCTFFKQFVVKPINFY